LFSQRRIGRKKANVILNSHFSYSYNVTKKLLSRKSCEDTFAFDTCSFFWKVVYKRSTRLNQPHCRGAGRRRWLQFCCL